MNTVATLTENLRALGRTSSTKGNAIEPVIFSALKLGQWTIGSLLDAFNVPRTNWPGWCIEHSNCTINISRIGNSRELGYANDEEFAFQARYGDVLMPIITFGPGILCVDSLSKLELTSIWVLDRWCFTSCQQSLVSGCIQILHFDSDTRNKGGQFSQHRSYKDVFHEDSNGYGATPKAIYAWQHSF